jgi:hypothetical protein
MPAYDRHKRRKAKRSGSEKGCWVFVPAAELEAAGIEPEGPVPWYLTHGSNVRGRRVIVNLYPERS